MGLPDEKDVAEEMAWHMNEAKPQPLGREHDAQFFEKLPHYPTPKLVSPVRKIVFSIRSADQGWGDLARVPANTAALPVSLGRAQQLRKQGTRRSGRLRTSIDASPDTLP